MTRQVTQLSPTGQVPRKRDPRLDFFRGVAMFIIFMAHLPGNFFTLYIPARFGWSDATEIFVFCSGMASAIAFGAVFKNHGWMMGTFRILHRMWQVYWAHIGLFCAVLSLMILQTWASSTGALCFYEGSRLCGSPETGPAWNYVGRLNIGHFLETGTGSPTSTNFLAFMTLTWVPNLFDILPMYFGILALVPIIIALYHIHPIAAAAFSLTLWLAAQEWVFRLIGLDGYALSLPAEPWSDREWFFNPFAWQLVFFTGFALMAGWLPKPPVKKSLIVICIAFVAITIPFAFWGIYRSETISLFGLASFDLSWANLKATREAISDFRQKTDFGILRYLHFLALAYLFWILAGEGGNNLDFQSRIGKWFVKIVHKVGQQSLATFMGGLFLARFCGFINNIINRNLGSVLFENESLAYWYNWFQMTLVNLLGMAGMVAIAYLVGWIKKTPWKNDTKQQPTVIAKDDIRRQLAD